MKHRARLLAGAFLLCVVLELSRAGNLTLSALMNHFSYKAWWNIHPRFFDQLLRLDPLFILWKLHQFLHFVMVKAPSFGKWVSERNKQLFHYRIQSGEGQEGLEQCHAYA